MERQSFRTTATVAKMGLHAQSHLGPSTPLSPVKVDKAPIFFPTRIPCGTVRRGTILLLTRTRSIKVKQGHSRSLKVLKWRRNHLRKRTQNRSRHARLAPPFRPAAKVARSSSFESSPANHFRPIEAGASSYSPPPNRPPLVSKLQLGHATVWEAPASCLAHAHTPKPCQTNPFIRPHIPIRLL